MPSFGVASFFVPARSDACCSLAVRLRGRSVQRMGRRTYITTFGRPAICDACWRSCITMDQEGARCFHCGEGVFVHRRFWTQCLCRECNGAGCDNCEHGLVIFPSEDPDVMAELPAYRAELTARAVSASSDRA